MSKQLEITATIAQYILDHSLREPPVLKELRQKTEQLPDANMMATPDSVQFITLLIKLVNAQAVLEIGTYTGYTSLAMALALPENGKIITCDISDERLALGRACWQKAGVENKIAFKKGEASVTLQCLIKEEKKFDLIFIDADKQGYEAYFEQAYILLRKGGLIVLDNMLLKGKVLDPKDNTSGAHLRQLTEKLHHDARIDFCLLPLADGIGLALKRIEGIGNAALDEASAESFPASDPIAVSQ